MATVDPAPQITRIVEVQDPGSGHYTVYVRVPPHLAAKFPDRPWGTGIGDIGLAEKDIVKFAGYVLVDIENISDRRIGDTADLFWVFQKLDGPIWTDRSVGANSLIPPKFQGQTTTTKTEQEVAPDTEPNPLTGDRTTSLVQAQKDTGKATRIEVTEVIDHGASPLEGQLTDTWGINTTEELLVEDGEVVDSGFGVKASQVTPLGNGKSVKATENYPPDIGSDYIIYKLEAQNTDDKSGIVLDIDKELVDAAQAKTLSAARRAAGWFPEIQPLDKWHSILISTKPDAASLPSPETWVETMNIRLPDRLTEVGVIWDLDSDSSLSTSGTDDEAYIEANNVRWDVAAEALVVGNISGRPYTKIESGRAFAANVSITRTYSVGPPVATITAHEFKPVHGMLVIKGIQASSTARGTQGGIGANRVDNSTHRKNSYDTNMIVHDFGPVEHSSPSITVRGDSALESPEFSLVQSASTGTLPGTGLFPSAEASVTIAGNVSLELSASSTPLVSTNTYIAQVSVREWGFGVWVREVYTVTIP